MNETYEKKLQNLNDEMDEKLHEIMEEQNSRPLRELDGALSLKRRDTIRYYKDEMRKLKEQYADK